MRMQRWGSLAVALVVLGVAGCNGGSVGEGGDGGGVTPTVCEDPGVATVSVVAGSPQLGSSAFEEADGVKITAFVKDSGNSLVQLAPVTFSSTKGALIVDSTDTGSTGTATATLTTGGDAANQPVTVTVTSCGKTGRVDLVETGTTAAVTGAQVVGSGASTTYTVALTDSSAEPIANETVTLTSALGNAITPASRVTDSNGLAVFTYTGTNGGNDTLTGSASLLNASSTYAVSIAASSLSFESPAENTNIPFGTSQPITVKYVQGGAPVSGATVTFSSTRGTFDSTTATTNGSGTATVNLSSIGSGGAGGAIIAATVAGGGPSATRGVQFVAVTPSKISIQASPTTIAPSGQSTVTAIVRDASDNLVANKTVLFTLKDTTNGTLSAPSGVTDSTGSVSVVYTATNVASSKNGVEVSAKVQGTTVKTSSPAFITVGGQALRITLGTGNEIIRLDETRYQLPYAVLVTDSAGNAVPGATFRLSIESLAYQKGAYSFDTVAGSWGPGWTIPASDPRFNSGDRFPFGCQNEDVDRDGVLDPEEDYNKNGRLEPGSVVSAPASIPLDSTGSAQFLLTYPKDRANWVEVRLTGIASVGGTETTASAEFILPAAADDLTDASTRPPGDPSPYGVSSTCKNDN